MSLGIHRYISELLLSLEALPEVCQKMVRKRRHRSTQDAPSLTESPFRVFTMQIHLSSHFSRHLVETLARIR